MKDTTKEKCPCRYEGGEKCHHEDCSICSPKEEKVVVRPSIQEKPVTCTLEHTSKNTQDNKEWAERFDENWANHWENYPGNSIPKSVKSFIASVVDEERRKILKIIVDEEDDTMSVIKAMEYLNTKE